MKPSASIDALFDSLRHGSAEVVGVALAAALIVGLRATLPESRRELTRAPFVFVLLYVVVAIVRWLAAPEGGWRRTMDLLALALLLLSLARAGVVLVVEVVLGRKRELPKIIRDIATTVVYAGVAIVVLRALGMDPGSLLATSALLTAVIGLSLQETLGNLFAGLAIQMQRPFEVGDWIQFDPDPRLIGRVLEINWRATKLLTLDEIEVVVPNGTLAKTAIRNHTKPSEISRRSVYVRASFDTPPHTVHAAILAALREVPGVVDAPQPSVVTHEFQESGVEYWVRYFIDDFSRRDIIDGIVRDRIWYALRRENIHIPFPQRSVHMRDVSEATKAAAKSRAIEERDRMLRAVEFLDALPEGEHRKLAAACKRRSYGAGEIIVSEGDKVNDLFIVEKGEVLVMLDRPGTEHDVELERLGPGKFFGEIEFLIGQRRYATVKAVTSTDLLIVDHEALREILQGSPEVAERLTRVLAERVDALEGHAAAIPTSDEEDPNARRSHLLTRIRRFFSI